MTSSHPLPGWVHALEKAEPPVLRHTEAALAALRQHEDSVSARTIAATILQDPLMAVRVLSFLAQRRGRSQNHDITTVDRALMMVGVSPFFKHFERLEVIEERLAGQPQALLGLLRVVGRARRAARFARDWAIVRHDLDVDEITVAALLHDLAEIVTWVFAPEPSLEVAGLLESTPGLRSHGAQERVFGFDFQALQLALARSWRLPRLLVALMDDAQAKNPRVRTVKLAVDLARHSAKGWDDPALPDDLAAIGELLRLAPEQLRLRVGAPSHAQWRGVTHSSSMPA